MKIDTQPLEDHQIKLTVEVEPKPFEESKQRAARKLARQAKIPGFRPGKAPYPVIVRHIGEPAIVEEAIEILVNDIYPEAIKEANIEAYGPGYLEQIVSIDPPTFEFIVPLRAEVVLGDYHSVRLPYDQTDIPPEQVDEVVKNLARKTGDHRAGRPRSRGRRSCPDAAASRPQRDRRRAAGIFDQ